MKAVTLTGGSSTSVSDVPAMTTGGSVCLTLPENATAMIGAAMLGLGLGMGAADARSERC